MVLPSTKRRGNGGAASLTNVTRTRAAPAASNPTHVASPRACACTCQRRCNRIHAHKYPLNGVHSKLWDWRLTMHACRSPRNRSPPSFCTGSKIEAPGDSSRKSMLPPCAKVGSKVEHPQLYPHCACGAGAVAMQPICTGSFHLWRSCGDNRASALHHCTKT